MATSPVNVLGYVGATPVDKRATQQGQYVLATSGETVLDRASGAPIKGVEVIGPAAVTGPVVVKNRGTAGTGTTNIVNFTVSGGAGTAWVPFFAAAAAGAPVPKQGDLLTVSGVPAGSAVRLVYQN